MDTKKIKQHNDQKFLDDVKRIRDIMVCPKSSGIWLHVKKSELLREAENKKIEYYITDKIFVQKRYSMVII